MLNHIKIAFWCILDAFEWETPKLEITLALSDDFN